MRSHFRKHHHPTRRSATCGLIFIGFLFVSAFVPRDIGATQSAAGVHLTDDSDWWSGYHAKESDPDETARMKADQDPQPREASIANFSILGVSLNLEVFKSTDAKLGVATPVVRGDASTRRT
ncbi:MAG: hypothetical protein ABSC71_19850, partial [Candidatus Acidiferrales bacterium]